MTRKRHQGFALSCAGFRHHHVYRGGKSKESGSLRVFAPPGKFPPNFPPASRFRTTQKSDLTIAVRLFLRSSFADLLVIHGRSTTALISEACHAVCAHRPSPPIFPSLFIIPSAFHFHGSAGPCRRRIVDFLAWRGVPDHPPRHLRASATSRRRQRAAKPPRAPPRSTLSVGVRPCGRRRERGGAAIGVCGSILSGA